MTRQVKKRRCESSVLDLGSHGFTKLAALCLTRMTAHQLPFGVLIRRWRERRRMTQADLAYAADSSTRHLSCLETGKALPSREMIARLAEYLEIPLRDQNALLLAAGFAPAFQERSLAALDAAKAAIEAILQAHKPYPAFAVDRHWNIVASNSALPQLYEGCSADLMRAPVNAVRLTLHPAGLGPRVVNYAAWRAHILTVLRQQIDARADPVSRVCSPRFRPIRHRRIPNRRKASGLPSVWPPRSRSPPDSASCRSLARSLSSGRPTM